jgi:hypothetical protein
MIRPAEPDDVRTKFLCAFSDGLVSGTMPTEKLKRLIGQFPAELQHGLRETAKVLLLLEQVWPRARGNVDEQVCDAETSVTLRPPFKSVGYGTPLALFPVGLSDR